jgi:hypothetical protein
MAYKIKSQKLPSEKKLKAYLELREIGATPRQADNFIKKHRIK